MAFVDAAGLAELVLGPGPITILGMLAKQMCGHCQFCFILYLTGLLILDHIVHAAVHNNDWVTHADTFPAGVTLETFLLPENIGLLQNIIYYHIIDGLHPAASLASGNLTTLSEDVKIQSQWWCQVRPFCSTMPTSPNATGCLTTASFM